MKLIFATHNSGKIKEMKEILSDLPIRVLSAEEAGVFEEPEENGKTFSENALKKAKFVADKTGEWTIADDSGICIDALDGEPGVYSARYAGEGKTDEELINFVLDKIKNIPEGERSSYFATAAVLVSPERQEYVFEGRVNGKISLEKKGIPRPKLPYDVIFIPEGYEKTFAEMSDKKKNSLSHRGKAFRKVKEFLTDFLDGKNQW